MNSEVYLNGQKLGSLPYGFTSFFVDLTPALKAGAGAEHADDERRHGNRIRCGRGGRGLGRLPTLEFLSVYFS
jgi:hypothetical protein